MKDILCDEVCTELVNLDEEYNILCTLRNSPPYLQKRKKDAFAMIRQLGFPSLLISLLAAKTKWPELLQALGKGPHKTEYTNIKFKIWTKIQQQH